MNIYEDGDNFMYNYKCNTFSGLAILFLFGLVMIYTFYEKFG